MLSRYSVSAKRVTDLDARRGRIICLGTIVYEGLGPVCIVEGLTEDGIGELQAYGLTVKPESRWYYDE